MDRAPGPSQRIILASASAFAAEGGGSLNAHQEPGSGRPRVVLNALFGHGFGGPHKRVADVARALAPAGFTTIVAIPEDADPALTARMAGGEGVAAVRFARIPRPHDARALAAWLASLPGDTIRFARLIRRVRADIVHVNGAVFLPPALAARLTGVPLVWHVNDTSVPVRAAKAIGRVVRALATVMVAAAAAVARHYGLPEAGVHVIYPPVDTTVFAPATARAEGPFRVGFLGNWSRDKGVPVFARAMARLARDAGWPFTIVLAGDRPARQRAVIDEAVAILDDAGLRERIEDHGIVADMAPITRSIDALVLSSVAEAAPIVILEAMACGVPVVATDVGGVRELVIDGPPGPAGIVVPARDHEAIAAAVARLRDDRALAGRLGANGRERAVQRFSLEACVEAHRRAYAEALGRFTQTLDSP